MKCWNNSEHMRFENLLKDGCEYKSKKKKINIRLSNKHLQNKWNSARFCCQKILAPDPIKCVAKYWLSQRSRLDAQHGDHIQQNQLHINALGDHHKSTQPD